MSAYSSEPSDGSNSSAIHVDRVWTAERTGRRLLRVFGAAAIGGVYGAMLGLANGIISAPPNDPRRMGEGRVSNEWYPLGVLAMMLFEGLVAFLVGAGLSLRFQARVSRRLAFRRALLGALAGLGAGCVLMRVIYGELIKAGLIVNLILQASAVVVVLVVSWQSIGAAAFTREDASTSRRVGA